MITEKNTTKKYLYYLLSIIGISFILYYLEIGCIIRYITNIPCPFCGISRAIFSSLNLNFSAALYYHPLFFIFPFYIIFLLRYIIEKKNFNITILLSTLYILVYLLRIYLSNIP
ncbi:DUF2752 domain-containing protein [Miniphocaeibacter massiliensis]|uniref:DUF2752 domain-containing protein n=1 Tax=Miniphocaeibacter massiliensis TaxID=2041841 RepID=UPI000C1B804D